MSKGDECAWADGFAYEVVMCVVLYPMPLRGNPLRMAIWGIW